MQTRHLKSNQKKQNKPVYLYVPQESFTADCSFVLFFILLPLSHPTLFVQGVMMQFSFPLPTLFYVDKADNVFHLPFFSTLLRVAFAKESEVLTGNLGDKLIPQNEILRDVSDLKALANVHESMEWLAARLKTFFANLPQTQSE